MKNILLVLLLTAGTLPAQAQFGFEAGLNMSNLSIKSGGTSVSTTFKPGETIGIMGDMSIDNGGHVYFEPGLFFQSNGAKIKTDPKGKYQISSLNVPLNIEYKTGSRCGRRFFFGIGPYIADNLAGSDDYDAIGSVPATSTQLRIGTDLQALDYGIGANVGYIGRKHLYIRLHYQQGLANEVPSGDSKNYIKQSAGSLTIGYMIRGCNRSSWFGGSGKREGNHWRGLKKNHWSRHETFRRPPGPGI